MTILMTRLNCLGDCGSIVSLEIRQMDFSISSSFSQVLRYLASFVFSCTFEKSISTKIFARILKGMALYLNINLGELTVLSFLIHEHNELISLFH